MLYLKDIINTRKTTTKPTKLWEPPVYTVLRNLTTDKEINLLASRNERLFWDKNQQLDTLRPTKTTNLLFDLAQLPCRNIFSFDNYMIFHTLFNLLNTVFISVRFRNPFILTINRQTNKVFRNAHKSPAVCTRYVFPNNSYFNFPTNKIHKAIS